MEICSATWSPEDQVLELCEILQGASAASLEKQFVNYVVGNIEPTGWRAVWRSHDKTCISGNLKQPLDYLVDVVNVSQDKLEASVIIKGMVENSKSEEINATHSDFLGQQAVAPLYELYPVALQDNSTIDIDLTTEVIEQVRFFFKNIWQPWDMFEECCCYDKFLISKRMQIYQEIQKGVIPHTVSSEMDTLKNRAKNTADEINNLEVKTGIANEIEVDQRDLVQLMKLNKAMEQLRMRYEALRDPALRELSIYQEQLERKDILASCITEEPANVLVVASSVSLENYVTCMARLPQVLKELSVSLSDRRVKTFPSLQMALDSAQIGDTVALLPGNHSLRNVGCLAKGGIMCGLGEGVEIIGCLATGDVLLDLYPQDETFSLRSIILKPLEGQRGVSLHGGRLSVKLCTFDGGSVGLSFLSGSECRVEESNIANKSLFGIECTGDSKVILKDVSISKCKETALRIKDEAKVDVKSNLVISDCPIGITLPDMKEDCSQPSMSTFNGDLGQSRNISTNEGNVCFRNTERNYVFSNV